MTSLRFVSKFCSQSCLQNAACRGCRCGLPASPISRGRKKKKKRAMVPVVTGTSYLRAPLTMDFSMAYGPPASHNENYVHSWLQDTVEARPLLLDKIVCFAMSDFGGTHAPFRLMITCAIRRYWFFLRTPLDICRPYLVVPIYSRS
jgi:hypothetical protein